jgi:hypothetical protein
MQQLAGWLIGVVMHVFFIWILEHNLFILLFSPWKTNQLPNV